MKLKAKYSAAPRASETVGLITWCLLAAPSALGAFAGCGSEASNSTGVGQTGGAAGASGGTEASGGGGTSGTSGTGGTAGAATGGGGTAGATTGGGGAGGEGGERGGAGGAGGECTPEDMRCSDRTPETCSPDGEWQPARAPCPFVCADGVCDGECVPGDERCTDDTAERCESDGTWSGTPCPNLCEQGECVDECTEGARQCSGDLVPQVCTNGAWVSGAPCPYSCRDGECTGECSPGSLRCGGTGNLSPETCDANALWQRGSACPFVCTDGVCTGECAPGDSRCTGSQPETCDSVGQWQNDGPACSGTTPVCTADGCEICTGGDCGWIRQFGTDSVDEAHGVAVDESGNVIVVGFAKGTLAGDDPLKNAFVRKYDPSGTELWTRVFRAGNGDYALGVAADSGGNLFVGGGTSFGEFPGQTGADYTDAFVRKYDATGTEQWTRQVGTNGTDFVRTVTIDTGGNVLVTGLWSGTVPDIFTGEESVLFRKHDTSGASLWSQDFGTSDFDDGYDVAAAEGGILYIGGKTHGTFPGQTATGGAFLRKVDGSGVEQWTRQFGTYASDEVRGVAVDESQNVYVAGSNLSDPFVRKFNASGTEQWSRQVESGWGEGVGVDDDGNAYIAGTTNETLPGQNNVGDYDIFVRAYGASGDEQWTRQIGSDAQDVCEDIAVERSGVVYVVGHTRGALPGHTNAGFADAFLIRIVQ